MNAYQELINTFSFHQKTHLFDVNHKKYLNEKIQCYG